VNWKKIKTNADNSGFEYEGLPIFKKYSEVLKFHEPGIAPVADESGSYHINSAGEPLYEERYLRSFGFYCSLAAVCSADDGCFHINASGLPAYEQRYSWCGNFQSDICTVRNRENQYFHIDLTGSPCYADTYRYAGDFKDGYASVRRNNGLFIHINGQGIPLNAIEFLDLGVFHKCFATARDAGGWHHIDLTGKPLYVDRYLAVEPFYNGFALVETLEGQKQIVDECGNKILSF